MVNRIQAGNRLGAGARNRLLRNAAQDTQVPAVSRLVAKAEPQESHEKTVSFSKDVRPAAQHEPHYEHTEQSLAYAKKMEGKFKNANKESHSAGRLRRADQLNGLVLEYRRSLDELRAEKKEVNHFLKTHAKNPALASVAEQHLKEIHALEEDIVQIGTRRTSPQYTLRDKPQRVRTESIRHEALADEALRCYRVNHDSSTLQPAIDHYRAELARVAALKGAPEKLRAADALFNSLLEIAKADTSLSVHGRQVERRHSDPGPQREEHKAPRRFSLGSSKPKDGAVSPEASSPAKPGFSFAEKFKKIQPMSFVERIKTEVSGRMASPAA